jgi:teichoic acid transport system ATP-binding protein
MNDVIIKVENLTKTFKLYDHPKDRLKEALSPFRKKYHHEYNALKDVSFEIKKGESVGILGKNGAGKSTLLKILTGVLTPSGGTVNVSGRVAALLELGSGFNPELSGMENIYFQGAILGLTKDEMLKKAPHITKFADIGEFIDQPVKTYSSGMFARLAFSIAINVEPDILIVDEALSVGDFAFQQKCFRKLKEIKESGITILFVSHDTSAVQTFCSKCLCLNNGIAVAFGECSEVIKVYYSQMGDEVLENSKIPEGVKLDSFGKGKARIVKFSAFNLQGGQLALPGEKFKFHFSIEFFEDLEVIGVGAVVKDRLGRDIFFLNNYVYDFQIQNVFKKDTINVFIEFEFPQLSSGRYSISPAVCEGVFDLHEQQHWIFDAQEITVGSKSKRLDGGIVCIPQATFSISRTKDSV